MTLYILQHLTGRRCEMKYHIELIKPEGHNITTDHIIKAIKATLTDIDSIEQSLDRICLDIAKNTGGNFIHTSKNGFEILRFNYAFTEIDHIEL